MKLDDLAAKLDEMLAETGGPRRVLIDGHFTKPLALDALRRAVAADPA